MVWSQEIEALNERAEELAEELTFITDAELSIEAIEDILATAHEDLSPEEAAELLGL